MPLPKLVRHVSKLKRQVAPADMTDLLNRLKAIDAARPAAAAAQGSGADQHEGLPRPDARPLTAESSSDRRPADTPTRGVKAVLERDAAAAVREATSSLVKMLHR